MHRFFCLFLFNLFIVAAALAESSPEQVLSEMIGKIQSSKDPSAIIEYVHWETAFNDLDDNQKRIFEVKTPEDLSSYYRKLLNDPESIIAEQLDRHADALPPERRDFVKERLTQIASQATREFRARKVRFLDAEYKVGKSTIKGDSAVVEMTSVSEGVEKQETINFIKVDGKWYLPSIDKVNQPAK